MYRILEGDAIEVLRTFAEASVDAIVTDPPYGLEFMGKDWDAPWKTDHRQPFDGSIQGGAGTPFLRSQTRSGNGASYGADQRAMQALRYGRDFIGIELNPAYVQIARMRIEEDAPLFNKISDQVSGVRCQSTGASGVGGVSEASEVSGARQAELFAEFRCGEARWGF